MSVTFYGECRASGRCVGVEDDEPSMQLANGNMYDLLALLGFELCPCGTVPLAGLGQPSRPPARRRRRSNTITSTASPTLVDRFEAAGCDHLYWA